MITPPPSSSSSARPHLGPSTPACPSIHIPFHSHLASTNFWDFQEVRATQVQGRFWIAWRPSACSTRETMPSPNGPPSHLYSALFEHNGYAGDADQSIKDAIEHFGTSGHVEDLTRILIRSLPLYHICIVVHKRRLIGAVVGFQNCNGSDVIEVERDLPNDKRNQLIIASYQCCNEMSLISGVFDVRMTFNAIVPKLIEIEPCLPMTSASHRFYRQVRSSCGVDLIACALLIGCDIQPMLPVEHSFLNMLRSRKCNFERTERIGDAKLLLNGTDY